MCLKKAYIRQWPGMILIIANTGLLGQLLVLLFLGSSQNSHPLPKQTQVHQMCKLVYMVVYKYCQYVYKICMCNYVYNCVYIYILINTLICT